MKLILIFLIFILFSKISIQNETHKKNSIYEVIKSTNAYIFTQMRGYKTHLPKIVHHEYDKSIKEYENLYISKPEDFVDLLWDRFNEMKYIEEQNDVEHIDEIINHEIFEFAREYLNFYNKLDDQEKATVDEYIESQEDFIKNVIKGAKHNEHMLDDGKFGSIHSLIENLPGLLLKNKTDPITNENYKPKKINQDFKSFIDDFHKDLNLDDIHKERTLKGKKKKIKEITKKIQPMHNKYFSSFFQEYIHEAVINDDDFKKYYTYSKMEEINLSKAKNEVDSHEKKINNLNRKLNTGFKFKSSLNTNTNKKKILFKQEPEENQEQDKEPEVEKEDHQDSFVKMGNELAQAATKLFKGKKEQEALNEVTNLGGSCEDQAKNLNAEIEKKKLSLKLKLEKVNLDLGEIPMLAIPQIGASSNIVAIMATDMVMQFVTGLAAMLVKHIPFFFFKFCLPAGPLVFGCCPEAAFFPQQLYGLFTSFEKVDKMKVVYKNFPGWLSGLGHDDFDEKRYMICAQTYFSIHLSANFNICFPPSIIPNQMTLLGQLPGDLPLCFLQCIPSMVICGAWLDDITPCAAAINIPTIIAAIIQMPQRLRLGMKFSPLCTYIPFLVHWDLVPEFDIEIPTPKPPPSKSCPEEKQKEKISSLEKELCDQDPNCMKLINDIKSNIDDPKEEKIEKRGSPVKKSPDERVTKVDLEKDFKMGKIVQNADSVVDVLSGNFETNPDKDEILYHILNYGKKTSKNKEKDFPYQTKRMIVDDWQV